MAVNWTEYFPEVMPDVPGCPVRMAENAIRQSAIEFCIEGRVWREKCSDITTAADTADYPVVVPADANVVTMAKVLLSGEYPLATPDQEALENMKEFEKTGEPIAFYQKFPGQITFLPTPDDIYTVENWAILKPTKNALSGPDFLYNDWLEQISAGAKARLLTMANRPWSAPTMYSFHRRIFVNGYIAARTRDAKANTRQQTMLSGGSFGFYRGNRI